MVHALEEIWRLLKPGGAMIDIHPVSSWLYLQAVHEDQVVARERKPMTYCMDILQAEKALKEVVERGLFLVEEQGEFDYYTHASSIDELGSHWDRINAHDDTLKEEDILLEEEEQYTRFLTHLQLAGDGAEVVVHERGRIARMRSA